MDEATLIGRLEALGAPDVEQARSRAVAAVPARVRAARSGGRGRPQRAALRLVTASAVVLAALVAFSVLTAPGHAFTAWIGDRLGLGQPGGHPTLQSLHHFAMEGTGGEGRAAYVLLRGPGPRGGHYELVTYRMKPEPGKEFPANGARCFQLEFPEARNLFQAGCGLPARSGGLIFTGVGGNSGPGAGYQFASGRVSDDVAAVDVEVDGRAVPVDLRSIPADLVERFRIRRPFKFFIAFLGEAAGGEAITVTARDATGHPLDRRTSKLLGASLMRR